MTREKGNGKGKGDGQGARVKCKEQGLSEKDKRNGEVELGKDKAEEAERVGECGRKKGMERQAQGHGNKGQG